MTSIGGFVVLGRQWTAPGDPAGLPVRPGTGYDGQFVYRLARQPWTTVPTAFGIRLDNPSYRQQRIVTPVIAWLLAHLPAVSTAAALVLVNALALVVASWYGARLAVVSGRTRWWGLVLALPAGMPISLGRDLTEPVAWAAVLAGLWYSRQRRWPAAAAALTVAVLGRETALPVVAGLGAAQLCRCWRRGQARQRVALVGQPRAGVSGRVQAGPGWLAGPVAVAAGWQVLLWRVWGVLPLRAGGSGNFGGVPALGVAGSVVRGIAEPGGPTWTVTVTRAIWTGERLALVVLFGYAAVTLIRDRSGVGLGERIAWALAVLIAVSLRGWTNDVQFLRAATEGIGLSVLVALGDRGRAGSMVLSGAALLTACVAVEYTLVL